MVFKELKTGYSIHLLNRNSVEYCNKKVTNVTLPHADAQIGGSMNLVVDVTTEDGKTYVMVAESETAYPDNMVISTDLSHIKREVDAMRSTAESALAQVEHQRELVTKCNQLMAEIDPAQKEKQQNEARFNKIESNLSELMTMMRKLTE